MLAGFAGGPFRDAGFMPEGASLPETHNHRSAVHAAAPHPAFGRPLLPLAAGEREGRGGAGLLKGGGKLPRGWPKRVHGSSPKGIATHYRQRGGIIEDHDTPVEVASSANQETATANLDQ